jgi:DNA-binding NarL/FixJ family response regulator
LVYHELNLRALHARLLLTLGRIADANAVVAKELQEHMIPHMRGEYLGARALALAISGDTSSVFAVTQEIRAITTATEATVPALLAEAVVSLSAGDKEPAREAILFAAQRATWDPVVCALRAHTNLAEAVSSFEELRPLLQEVCEHAGDRQLARRLRLKLRSASATSEDALSPREHEVLDLMTQGLRNPEIAAHLFISESTVKVHVRHIFEKLGVRTRAQAVARVNQRG